MLLAKLLEKKNALTRVIPIGHDFYAKIGRMGYCNICFEDKKPLGIHACGHFMCVDCRNKWSKHKLECPTCKAKSFQFVSTDYVFKLREQVNVQADVLTKFTASVKHEIEQACQKNELDGNSDIVQKLQTRCAIFNDQHSSIFKQHFQRIDQLEHENFVLYEMFGQLFDIFEQYLVGFQCNLGKAIHSSAFQKMNREIQYTAARANALVNTARQEYLQKTNVFEQLEQHRDATVKELLCTLEQAEAKNVSYMAQIEALTQTTETLQRDLSAARVAEAKSVAYVAQIEALTQVNETLKRDLSAARVAETTLRVERDARLRDTKTELLTMQTQCEHLTTHVAQLTKLWQNAENVINEKTLQLYRAEGLVAAFKTRSSIAKELNAVLQENVAGLQREVAELHAVQLQERREADLRMLREKQVEEMQDIVQESSKKVLELQMQLEEMRGKSILKRLRRFAVPFLYAARIAPDGGR